jgi:RNA polymerase sigma-70 factor (ECF subfamily)
MPATSTRPPIAAGPDEATLVDQAKHDRHAFALLYHRYVAEVYRYCYRRLGSKEEAEDATSQVFTKALAGIARLGDQPFRAWLFTIAHNVVADTHRARRRAVPAADRDARAVDAIDPDLTPEAQLLAAEDGRFIRMLLAQLPADSRHLLELRLAGLTDAEIAEVLGKSHGAVRTAQHRTVVRLRELRAAIEESERVRV